MCACVRVCVCVCVCVRMCVCVCVYVRVCSSPYMEALDILIIILEVKIRIAEGALNIMDSEMNLLVQSVKSDKKF